MNAKGVWVTTMKLGKTNPKIDRLSYDLKAKAIGSLVSLSALMACSAPETTVILPNRDASIGMTADALRQCAGSPRHETKKNGNVTVLSYYKEAPILQQSFSGARSSISRLSLHACWVTARVEQETVKEISYRSVPQTIDASMYCEAILKPCNRSR